MTIIIDDTVQSISASLNPSIVANQSQYSTYVSSNTFYSSNSNALYQLGLRYTKTEVDSLTTLTNFYNKTAIDTNIYTKTQSDNNYYSKTAIDNNIYTKTQSDANYYSKTATDTLLNAKQATLTFSAPLLNTANNISINLNSYVPFSALSSSNYINNTSLLSYTPFTALNSSNYVNNNLAVKYTDITSSNFDTIALRNTSLLSYTPFTALNSSNYVNNNLAVKYTDITSSNFLTTSTANTTYLKLDGSASMTSKLLLLTGGNGNPSFATTNGGSGDRIVFQSGIAGSVLPYSIGYSLNNLWISAPQTASINTYIDGSIKWSVGSTGGILYGILNATTLQEGGTNLDAKYLRLSGASAMSGALTVNGNININSSATNKLIFDNVLNNRKIELSTNHSIGVDNNGMIFSASAFRFAKATNINDIVFTVSAVGDLSFAGTIYSGAISTGGGILASSLTLGSTGDIITVRNITASGTVSANSFTEGGVSLSSKYLTTASLATTYLKLDGTNSMTGNLGIGNTNPTSKLCINPNPVYGGVFNFATCPCIITNPTPSGTTLNDPQPVLHLCREGTLLQSYAQRISFYLSRYENNALNSRTRCDIVLAENEFLNRTVMTLLSSGNIGIGKTNPNCRLYIDTQNGNTTSQSYSLRIGSSGTISDSGAFANLIGLGIEANGWSKGAIGWVRRGGWDQGDMVFLTRNTGDSADADLNYERMRITGTGRVGINTNNPNCQFTVVGVANINNGSPYATANNTMASGSLTIGGLNVNYGGGNNWTTNTAGFMMECQDNTEIMIHDSGNRLASFMRYVGAGTNQFYIGRDAGWGTIAQTNFFGNVYLNNSLFLKTDVWNYSTDNKERIYFANNGITYFRAYNNGGVPQTNCYVFRNNGGTDIIGINDNGNTFFVGEISAKFTTISGSYRDLLGCYVENSSPGNSGNYTAYLIQGTFTGIHRVFTEDPLFIKEEPQKFKDDYEGRIVISNGKIATDTNEDKDLWEIKYEKDGITIEDALPMIELSRKKKDKRVFGVIGASKRQTNRPERIIINSVGEGAIWICNSNGNIENGDFIQSSAYLGYGERQDDDLFHNYTVGKITIDCDFILDSPLYQCKEIDDLDENGNKLRVAFVSCVYHCG
jgi:hypothetical protein